MPSPVRCWVKAKGGAKHGCQYRGILEKNTTIYGTCRKNRSVCGGAWLVRGVAYSLPERFSVGLFGRRIDGIDRGGLLPSNSSPKPDCVLTRGVHMDELQKPRKKISRFLKFLAQMGKDYVWVTEEMNRAENLT